MGGLMVATILTLIVLPALYELVFDRPQHRGVGARLQRASDGRHYVRRTTRGAPGCSLECDEARVACVLFALQADRQYLATRQRGLLDARSHEPRTC